MIIFSCVIVKILFLPAARIRLENCIKIFHQTIAYLFILHIGTKENPCDVDYFIFDCLK
nr:MAG TPA: hypothetical protein [Bacteriophage sp.]DAW65942.1 MAG TPA: hypothetical protein [Bacteriophage sp.]